MKIYKITVDAAKEDGEAPIVEWLGTQAECASARKRWNSVEKVPREDIKTEEVDVPTDKKGLLAWLNENMK